ncbi:hypothetical protein [Kroppenstedtia sanguinis]
MGMRLKWGIELTYKELKQLMRAGRVQNGMVYNVPMRNQTGLSLIDFMI